VICQEFVGVNRNTEQILNIELTVSTVSQVNEPSTYFMPAFSQSASESQPLARPSFEPGKHQWRVVVCFKNQAFVHGLRNAQNLSIFEFDVVTGSEKLTRVLGKGNSHLLLIEWDGIDMQTISDCANLRAAGIHVPIIFVSDSDEIEKKQLAFAAGADDFLTKPVELLLLGLKIDAMAKRPVQVYADLLKVGIYTLDRNNLTVWRNERQIGLAPLEFRLLELLMVNVDRVITQDLIMEALWPSAPLKCQDVLRTCLKKIRSKIDTPGRPSVITNVHGIGYRFERWA
jgi:DNA-binding response OmpR family regulator